MRIVNVPPAHETYFAMLDRRRIVRRVLGVLFVAVALLVSAAGTALAINELADADSDVEGY